MELKNVLGLGLCLFFLWFCGAADKENESSATSTDYKNLVRLFKKFRDYQKPEMVNGVPDYTQEAMAKQIARLPEFRTKLADIDPSGWPIEQRVDYEVLSTKMNPLEFDITD